MNNPTLSILIISYNTKQITVECLDSIFKQTDSSKLPYEIILIDNASKDGSVEAIKRIAETHKEVHLIENDENIGFGRANNQAAKLALGQYLLLLNSDTIVLDRAIEKLMHFYKENEAKIHFLGPKLLNKDMTLQPSVAPFYSPLVVFGALFLRGDYWGLTRSSPTSVKQVGWIHGACFLTKKEYFDKIKGFDSDVFMYMEEVDLMYRAYKAGFSRYFFPGSTFIHLGSASSGGRTFPILQVYRGFLYFYKKHYGAFSLFLLKCMLKLKAVVGIVIGKITNNDYLITTYEQANKLVKMD